jgi:hypothetical protein
MWCVEETEGTILRHEIDEKRHRMRSVSVNLMSQYQGP